MSTNQNKCIDYPIYSYIHITINIFCGKEIEESEKICRFMFVSKAEKQKGCSMYSNSAAIKNTKLFILAEEKPFCLHNISRKTSTI